MNEPALPASDRTTALPADDAALRFRMTDYAYAPISETGAVAYSRAWRSDVRSPPMTIARARADAQRPEAQRQLENELALTARLDHAWAMKSTGSVTGAGQMVLLYDDADTISLEQLAPHALAPASFIRLATRLAHTLESVHAAGLTHRNINPGCFFIEQKPAANSAQDYHVKIGGFGFARTAAKSIVPTGAFAHAIALLAGNLPYMSPEHSGRMPCQIDARSDLYSLGVIFYRLLTGHLPFGVSGVENDVSEWVHFHIASEPVAPHLLSSAVPETWSRIVMRLLEKDPARRYQQAAQLHQDLAQLAPPPATTMPVAADNIFSTLPGTKAVPPPIPMDNATPLPAPRPSIVPRSETASIKDLESVIRAARALSEEIRLDALIQTIMAVTLEHVGAERGALIRLDGQDPYIEACARTTSAGVTVDLRQARATENDLPMAMLHQALSTGRQVYANETDVQIASPADGNASAVSYGAGLPRFNAICVPMLKQNRVIGALYLENRVLPDAFTVEHTQIVQLLASQAAISLETARLYASLLAENAQRTAAERALRSSQSSLVLGEQFNHIGSLRYLLEEGLMICSAELCRIYGLEAGKDIISHDAFAALLHPDDRKTVLDTMAAAVATGGTIRIEHRIVRNDGDVRYISGIGKPFYVNGKFTEYVGTATDITSRRQAEDALRVAQADLARVSRATTVGQLTASIAHEINQPLMSIVSNAAATLRWLDRGPMHLENARAGLRDIVTEGQRAGDMIQSLQSLTRNTEPVLARIDLNAAIRHILAISRSEIERREVSLDLSLDLSLARGSLHAMGDFIQIQQVLLNLVINAIEAMSEVHTRARVLTITSSVRDGKRIAVAIEDTGEGIAADATRRVFDAFYTTKKNGMGMGLAICRSIIENHQGTLEAAVRQPFGSIFSFDLPLLS